jgi:hypothetical protein
MNSILLLLLLLSLVVIFLFSLKTENFATSVTAATKFYPTNQNMILDNCANINYYDCITDPSENCLKDIKIVNGCRNKTIKIYTDMIYGNEYIFLENSFLKDDLDEVTLEGMILVRFDKISNWFKVGVINEFGFNLHKLYSNLDSNNLPVETSISWKHNEPIVFIHRQTHERLKIQNLDLDDTNILYYGVHNDNIIFVKAMKETLNESEEVKRFDLNGKTITFEALNEQEIKNIFEQSNTDPNKDNYILEKSNVDLDEYDVLKITNSSQQMRKINSKTLYYGENNWKDTYNPSDTYIDKNITLLSKLYVHNNEIKNLEKDIDKIIEKIK